MPTFLDNKVGTDVPTLQAHRSAFRSAMPNADLDSEGCIILVKFTFVTIENLIGVSFDWFGSNVVSIKKNDVSEGKEVNLLKFS